MNRLEQLASEYFIQKRGYVFIGQAYKDGYNQAVADLQDGLKGACSTCEPVAEKNHELQSELVTFNDLDERGKFIAIKDYIYGWNETHADDPLDEDEVLDILSSNDDYLYDINGIYKEV